MMKRSRLKLFKTTSLTISLIGVILILITIGVIAYIGVSTLTNSVSTTVSSGSAYDQLNQVKSEYALICVIVGSLIIVGYILNSLLGVLEFFDNIVQKTGSWFSYNDEKIAQGKENCKQYLKDHPDIYAEVESKVRAAVSGGENIISTEIE